MGAARVGSEDLPYRIILVIKADRLIAFARYTKMVAM